MSRAVIPNLPPISSIKDPDVRVALESMWNAWRVRNGDVGDGEHKFLTAADLKDAVDSQAFARGNGGTLGSGANGTGSGSWVGPLIASIQDDIMQSRLWKILGERIEWIDTPEWFVNKFDRSFGTAIKNEQLIRESADSSLASSISTVSAALNGNIAVVQQTLTANVTLTEATASSLTLLKTEFDDAVAGFQEDITTISNSVSALSQSTTQYITQINENIGLIQLDVQSVTDLAGTHTSQITTLQNDVDGVEVSAQNAFDLATTVEGKVSGSWTVKFDANGYVTGAGLGLEGKSGSYSSSFLVRADKFAVGSPEHPSITPTVPFVVYTTPTNIAGRVVPPGAYMDSAFITRITADQIDTRGLSIKDAYGNVILSSGTALATDYISGLGSLATQNSVSYSSVTGTKPPTNADKTSLNTAAGIANQGAFATLSKILPSNVTTYIADLAVDTLQLAGNAVTIPSTQQSSNAVGGDGGLQIVNQISYYLDYPGSVLIIFNGRQNYDSGPRNTAAAIYVDGWDAVPVNIAGAINDFVTVSWSGALAAGWHTIQIYWHGQDGSVRISNRTLSILGTMK